MTNKAITAMIARMPVGMLFRRTGDPGVKFGSYLRLGSFIVMTNLLWFVWGNAPVVDLVPRNCRRTPPGSGLLKPRSKKTLAPALKTRRETAECRPLNIRRRQLHQKGKNNGSTNDWAYSGRARSGP